MKRMIWAGQVIALYSFTWFVALVPERLSDRLGVAVGLLLHRVLGNRRRVAEDNIRRCLYHMRAQPALSCAIPDGGIARVVFCNIGRSLVGTCQLYHGRGAALIDRVERPSTTIETGIARFVTWYREYYTA
jgi:KDO2-lipid IV(A) lauroyltransferase